MKTQIKVEPVFSQKRPTTQNSQAAKAKAEMEVPFLRPSLSDEEIAEVVDTLRSGWLTAGPKVKAFEEKFAEAVNASHAVALNSCTAALHLAVEALGLRAGQAVLVPTMTFAATAEIVLYKNAIPIMVDCDSVTGNMDLTDARRKIEDARAGRLSPIVPPDAEIVGVIPVHVGGYMLDIDELKSFAEEFNLWIVEDAAHAFPAAWRKNPESEWLYCGENTSHVTCFSFYANKTITTGEGGMAVTANHLIAEKIRLMSLHGLSRDAWKRYTEEGSWDYLITEPGYKYNLTDIAASIGIHQLDRAEAMRRQREEVAEIYLDKLANVKELSLPPDDEKRLHSWHLFPVRLNLRELSITRNAFIKELKRCGVGCSVHWRPLHLHPFYSEKLGWREHHLPTATALWSQLISLPIFPSITTDEIEYVVKTVKTICTNSSKRKLLLAA
jgi:dTDP-4-amino-4,6-dideoxygalactose transaminase